MHALCNISACMTNNTYDLVVIGGGPAGYVGAIKAAQLGMKVACVEKRGSLGGTCLNVGCIPSKALLHSSELFEQAKHGEAHGICGTIKLDWDKMRGRKDEVVKTLTQGIEGLFKKNKVDYIIGHGIVMGKGEVAVKKEKGAPESLKTKNIMIATGSSVIDLPNVEIDEERIVSSTGALELKEVPKKLTVIGGGVIGLELGSVYRRLGAEVEVIEFLDGIIPGNDKDVRKQFQKILEKQGITFKLSTKVTGAAVKGKQVEIVTEDAKGGNEQKSKSDVVLVAIGRKPNTHNLGLSEAKIEMTERGRIKVDTHFRTNVEGVYAVGDVIDGPMLAHKAEEDAVAAVEIMAGQAGHVDYDLVPAVIYTHPEVATIGKTEDALKEAGAAYKVGKFPFMANSRARTMGESDGFVKLLADKNTDEVLGVHIIGPQAGTIIAEAATAMTYKAASEDIARICHSHPDLNEAVKEAANITAFGKPINM